VQRGLRHPLKSHSQFKKERGVKNLGEKGILREKREILTQRERLKETPGTLITIINQMSEEKMACRLTGKVKKTTPPKKEGSGKRKGRQRVGYRKRTNLAAEGVTGREGGKELTKTKKDHKTGFKGAEKCRDDGRSA